MSTTSFQSTASAGSLTQDSPIVLGQAVRVRSEAMVRVAALVPWIAAALVLAVGLMLVDGLPVGVAHDDGMYVILSKALASGRGYRWIHVPGAPPATHFPPGYPAVLAVLWRIFPSFPQNIIAFKALNGGFLAAASFGIAIFARRRLRFGAWSAGAAAVIGAIAVPTLVLSTLVMSEPMFLALLIPLLLWAERIVDDRPGLVSVALLGFSIGALTLVRSHGVALVAALALVLLAYRRWRELVVFVTMSVAAMLPWQLWERAHRGFVPPAMRGNYESYTAWLIRGLRADGVTLVFRTLARTSHDVLGTLAIFSGLPFPGPARVAVLVAVLGLIAAGLWRLARLAPVTAAFLVVYFGIVLAWPFAPERFLWGLWPLIFLVPVLGVVEIHAWRPSAVGLRAARGVALVGALAAAAGFATYNVRGYRGRWWTSIPRQQAAIAWPIMTWTATHTPPGAVVASRIEPMLYLYTGRKTVPVSSFTVDQYFHPTTVAASDTALRQILSAYHVDAIAILSGDSVSIAANRMTAEHPPELVRIDSFANGVVFAPSAVPSAALSR